MKALSIRLDDDLNEEFDELCHQEGYKKNGVVVKLIRGFVQKKRKPKGVKIKDLMKFSGVLSLGGDAMADTEHYDD